MGGLCKLGLRGISVSTMRPFSAHQEKKKVYKCNNLNNVNQP